MENLVEQVPGKNELADVLNEMHAAPYLGA